MDNLKQSILIVDDELPQLKVLSDEFVDAGFRVLKAENGQEGLELALREHPDISLLDIVMPVMDGMTMLKRLREETWGKSVPVILLTNLSPDDEGLIQNISKTEPAYYLVKSNWDLSDVLLKVKERLARE